MPTMSYRRVLVLVVLVSVVSGVTGAFAVVQMTAQQPSAATPSPENPTPTQPTVSTTSLGNTASTDHPVNASAFKHAYTEVMDSVVSIKTVSGTGGESEGSGWVYDANGHIVTNNHVIQGAERVEVRFRDGEWRSAEVVGTDVYSDLAVLKVDNPPRYATPLPVARSDPTPGSIVMALGNPFGLQETITHGIVSGVNRTMETAGGFSIPDTVQTDAAINPGNSGGPLVNTDGTVVGVNRAKQGDNIGFAISPTIFRRVVPALINDGDYAHPYLGVRMADITPRLAEANDLKEPRGVLVVGVVENGPSDGVLQGSQTQMSPGFDEVPVGGDVILSIDGRTVNAPRQLSSYLATQTSPGETVTLAILRDGSRKQVDVTLGTRPGPDPELY